MKENDLNNDSTKSLFGVLERLWGAYHVDPEFIKDAYSELGAIDFELSELKKSESEYDHFVLMTLEKEANRGL